MSKLQMDMKTLIVDIVENFVGWDNADPYKNFTVEEQPSGALCIIMNIEEHPVKVYTCLSVARFSSVDEIQEEIYDAAKSVVILTDLANSGVSGLMLYKFISIHELMLNHTDLKNEKYTEYGSNFMGIILKIYKETSTVRITVGRSLSFQHKTKFDRDGVTLEQLNQHVENVRNTIDNIPHCYSTVGGQY